MIDGFERRQAECFRASYGLLISTGLQPGVRGRAANWSRFNGFDIVRESR